MPVIAITANSTLDYSGSVDTTYTSQSFEDIYIGEQSPTYAYDGDSPTTLSLGDATGEEWSPLIRTAAINANVPSGSTINSATMRLYFELDLGDGTVNMHGMKRAWVIDEVSWNNYETGSAWQTAGAIGADDYESTPDSSTAVTDTGYLDVDVTDIVQGIRDGTYDSFMIKASSSDPFRWITRSTSTDGQRVEIIINYASIAITGVTGTVQPGGQIVISTNNLGTATSVTLGGEALTIDGTDTDEVTATIPTDIDLKWGEATYTLSVGDGSDTATLENQTLTARSGWAYVNYAGPIPDASSTESFYELSVNDRSHTPVSGNQLQYTTDAALSVDASWVVTVDPAQLISGQYNIFTNTLLGEENFYVSETGSITSGGPVRMMGRFPRIV